MFFHFIYKVLQIRNKKGNIYSFGLAVLFALLYTLGFNIDAHSSVFILTHKNFAENTLVFGGQITVLYTILSCLFNFFSTSSDSSENYKSLVAVSAFKKEIFILDTMAFYLSVMDPLFYIINFPGTLSPDPMNEIMQIMGDSPFSDYIPIFQTLFIDMFLKIGSLFSHSH